MSEIGTGRSDNNDGPYAHSRNAAGRRQDLRDHLEAVAGLAADNAAVYGSDLARAAGLWHDLGKYNPEWQSYLLGSEAGTRARGTGPDHKGAGAVLASRLCEPLAFPVAGHHGGLPNRADLASKLTAWGPGATEALRSAPGDLQDAPGPLAAPAFVDSALEAELFIRMLFSALVDADYLDTENHLQPDHSRSRDSAVDLSDLWDSLRRHHDNLSRRDGEVSAVRAEVYANCLAAAEWPTGIFRLSVPTGGGKTLSGMAFALGHALKHDLKRVIVAVPYTSITDQTARVYRDAFGQDKAVLEHHSAVRVVDNEGEGPSGLWARLAAENWDAPVIVTTTVQLFESLFANGPAKCRKLHRLAGSVVILDEAQALPTGLLAPILDALRSLARNYRVTVLVCTATQPAFDEAPGFRGLTDIREIVPDPVSLFSRLKRVRYEVPDAGETRDWSEVAREMRAQPSALAIVNSRPDAVALFDALGDQDAFHLSTSLCGAHRWAILAEVRQRLAAGTPCRLVSTQVVEAGVDIDFPVVLRALGPLDSIVQAAGRCNREGRLSTGRLILFQPMDGKLPRGTYRTATDITLRLLREGKPDFHDPALYRRYFRLLVDLLPLDVPGIQVLRTGLRYEDVAREFRMIDDATTSVVVPYGTEAAVLLERVRRGSPTRDLMRSLQPYLVAVPNYSFRRYEARGLVEEVQPGLYHWLGRYDRHLGIVAENDVLLV